MRKVLNLNSSWYFTKENVGFKKLHKADLTLVDVPHTWNNLDGQDGGADYYRGTCWYSKKLGKIELAADEVAYIEFEGVQSIVDCYFNGKLVAHHEGGFSTWRVNVTDLLDGENELVLSVDNADNDRVYPQMADFTFYGGIYRPVNLIITNKQHFDLDFYGAPGVAVTPVVDGANANVKVDAYVTNHDGALLVATVLNNEGEVVLTKTSEKLSFDFVLENVHLWDGVEDPYLYTLKLDLVKDETVLDNKVVRFGARSFNVTPDGGFFLNGRSYPLRGVSRHQDRKDLGWAITEKEHKEDMELIKEVGANTIRLAHYQHSQCFYDLCDEYGMVVWAEIPFISSFMPNGRANTVSQMKELIYQNYNHPSIVVWGLSNEITISGESEALLENHYELNDLCHELDKTRLTTMAAVSMLRKDSPMNRIPDVLSYNHYFGWYGGDVEDNPVWFDTFHAEYPDICLGCSEYGCECVLNWHTSTPEQGDYSEEYQAYYHYEMLKTFEARPWLWATHVWNMFDFAADARDEGGVKGMNNKGLVTYDRKTKKDSFYLYQAFWTKKPMLHLAKKRYVYRCEDETQVLVYTNLDEVSLYVNGELFETKKGYRVFEFKVPLNGKLELRAVAGDLEDTSVVEKVAEPHKDYILESDGGVANWFTENGEGMTFDRNYFCIKDKMKTIMANPQGKALLEGMMASMMPKEGGEVAGFKVSEGMLKMMMNFTIERMAKMAGKMFPQEALVKINAALQQIKK